MTTTNLHRRWLAAGAILVLWLAYALRLFRLAAQSIWWDEGHSIFVAAQPLAQIPTLPAMDVHPPAYFALLHLWQSLAGSSEFALRYLSVLFGLLTVALLWRFARELAPGGAAAWLAGLFAAISPLYVAYSQEVRSYAMFTLLALGSTFFLWRIVSGHLSFVTRHWSLVTRHPSLVTFSAYVLLTTACLYTHYFTIFLLLFHNAVWLVFAVTPYSLLPTPYQGVRSREFGVRGRLMAWLGSQAATLLLFAPQLALAVRQVRDYANPNLLPPPLIEFFSRSWQAYTAGLAIDPAPGGWAAAALAAVIVITWGIVLIRPDNSSGMERGDTPHPPRPAALLLFLLGWLLMPLAAYFIVLQLRPSFEPRYLMLVSPAIFLLLAVGLAHLRFTIYDLRLFTQRPLRFTFYVLFLASLAALLTGLYSYFTNETTFKDDSAGVARWLAAETTANDIVFVDVPHPFHYYAERIPAPTRYLFVDVHTAAATLNTEAAGRDRLYWVTWYGSDTDPRGVIPFLAEKAGQPAGQRDFKGYHVQWYNLPPDATFSLPTNLPAANATFGDVLRLDGAAFSDAVTPEQPVWATLHFSLLRETEVNYKVSLRLRDKAGQVIAQLDRDLLNDRHFRTAAWPLADPALNQAINVYLLPLPPDAAPGAYHLEAVLYNAQPPYPGEGVSGQATADGAAALLGEVVISEE